MKIEYKYILFGVFLLLGLALVFLPVDQAEVCSGKNDTKSIVDYQIEIDDMAHCIMTNDPSYQLIDLRTPEEVAVYAVPTAENIPLANFKTDETLDNLDRVKKIILAGKDEKDAREARTFLLSNGFTQVYVLLGGVDNWLSTFRNLEPPAGSYSDSDMFHYNFYRSTASVMLGEVVVPKSETEVKVNAPKPMMMKKRGAKKIDEGC